jgi:hypothetical protein
MRCDRRGTNCQQSFLEVTEKAQGTQVPWASLLLPRLFPSETAVPALQRIGLAYAPTDVSQG